MSTTKLSTRLARVVASIALVTLVAGCGASDDVLGNDNTGGLGTNFDATLTGGSAGTYRGLGSAAAAGNNFTVGFATTDGKFALAISRFGTRPSVGSYPIGPTSPTGFSATITISSGILYLSTSGTLTITSSSSSEVKGSFTFNANVPGGGGGSTSVTGNFTAPCPAGC